MEHRRPAYENEYGAVFWRESKQPVIKSRPARQEDESYNHDGPSVC